MECIRCGECCKQAPCTYGRVRHRIAKGKQCHDLVQKDGTYTCLLIEQSLWVKEEFVGTGCHWPEYRVEVK